MLRLEIIARCDHCGKVLEDAVPLDASGAEPIRGKWLRERLAEMYEWGSIPTPDGTADICPRCKRRLSEIL
jgi:hypothetical protein